MLYTLVCPNCQAENSIESEDIVTDWACEFCDVKAVSSLPTDGYGNLIEQVKT